MEEDIFEWMVHCPRSSSWKRKGRGSIISEQRTCPLHSRLWVDLRIINHLPTNGTLFDQKYPRACGTSFRHGAVVNTLQSDYQLSRVRPFAGACRRSRRYSIKAKVFGQLRIGTSTFLNRNSCTIRCESPANSASVRARSIASPTFASWTRRSPV
jgi:hypothetical protein